MKHLILLFSLLCSFVAFGQGSSCSSPYNLILDGVYRTYALSTVTGSALHCTDSMYSGTGKITAFSFTTNATGSCVLIDLTTSGYQPAEVLLYTKCSGGGAMQNLETPSSVCFNDGTGLWAPSETLVLSPNKTYFLRVWTKDTGTISMSAKNYDPPNNTCSGATAIGPTPIADNNACHKPGQGILPEQLCAFSLENTAFYYYIVDLTGISVLMISNISCDNSAVGATAGFQIGFFTGTCDHLIPLSCYAGLGGSVSAPTVSLPAGTRVTVAIDGMSGSNCSYTISAFNAVFLPVSLKYFAVWMAPGSNILRWSTATETDGSYFEIEKSTDGFNFSRIGTVQGKNNSSTITAYTFNDPGLLSDQFYRLKIPGSGGKYMYSNVVHVQRQNIQTGSVVVENPASDHLHFRVNDPKEASMNIQIANTMGQVVHTEAIRLTGGNADYSIDIHSLNRGVYYLFFPGNGSRNGYSFIKE